MFDDTWSDETIFDEIWSDERQQRTGKRLTGPGVLPHQSMTRSVLFGDQFHKYTSNLSFDSLTLLSLIVF